MRAAGAGSIVTISSLASTAGANMIAYEVSKAALNRLTIATALGSASRGVRCNAILPGLIDTPMGVGGTAARDGRSLDDQRAARDAMVPLKGGMGSGWDVANAALFLASDEAKFVTGVLLPVDGGQGARIG
jgi:NAD(P)-dependent dehydrogenase (short-subunit alcohol dehydrogenase family)